MPGELASRHGRPEDGVHPTWSLPMGPEAYAFGGELPDCACGVCGGPLHRLLTLEAVPEGLGVSAAPLTLATCLSCLGWEAEELFYRHAGDGRPESLDQLEPRVQPEFPSPPLRAMQVRLAPTPPRWRWQAWGMSNGRENPHRLGGHPSWVQDAVYPDCPRCGEAMHFLLQLDSGLPTADGGKWLWGSGGLVYVFWCDPCRVSGMFWQCT